MSAHFDDSIVRIFLQFMVGNKSRVPTWAWLVSQGNQKTIKPATKRLPFPKTEPFIPPTTDCSVATLVGDLEAAGFQVVGVFCKEQISEEGGRARWRVSFEFSREVAAGTSDEQYRRILPRLRSDLVKMAGEALWQVRAYRNPLREENGTEMPGRFALSVNCDLRKALFEGDNLAKPVLVWQKDTAGNRIGDVAVPLGPKYLVRVVNGAVQPVAIS